MTRQLFIGDREYFSGIGRIQYEGPQSKNPLAFKAYDASRSSRAKPWRNTCALPCVTGIRLRCGLDPFGVGTRDSPGPTPVTTNKLRMTSSMRL